MTDGDGRSIASVYGGDRLVQQTWYNANGSVANVLNWNYDSDGNLLSASNNAGTYTMTYDGNQLSSQTTANGVSLNYQYDATGNVTQITDSLGDSVTSKYDGGNLVQRGYSGPHGQLLLTMSYDAVGNLIGVNRYSNLAGTQLVGSSTYAYDGQGDVTQITHKDGTGNVLASFNYAYDTAGRLTSEVDNGTTTTYTYDAAGQLTGAGSVGYSYDANGNPTSLGDSVGPNNELLSDGTWNYNYDAVGNLIGKVGVSAGPDAGLTWTYSYDANNEMTGATETNSQGQTLVQDTFTYDIFGHLIASSVSLNGGTAVASNFVYNSDELWAQLNGPSQSPTMYISGDQLDQYFAQVGVGTGVSWLLTDHLGSVRVVTNAAGQATGTNNYDARGNVVNMVNPAQDASIGYAGSLHEVTTGFNYELNRWYNPQTGQWTTEDPLGLQAGPNTREYINDAPTNAVDPTGEEPVRTGINPNPEAIAKRRAEVEAIQARMRAGGPVSREDQLKLKAWSDLQVDLRNNGYDERGYRRSEARDQAWMRQQIIAVEQNATTKGFAGAARAAEWAAQEAGRAVENLEKAGKLSLKYIPGDIKEKAGELVSAESLKTLAALTLYWAVSQATPPSAVVADVVMTAIALKWAGTEAIDVSINIGKYAYYAVRAKNDEDLDRAARHLAKAVAAIVVDGGAALVAKGAHKAGGKVVRSESVQRAARAIEEKGMKLWKDELGAAGGAKGAKTGRQEAKALEETSPTTKPAGTGCFVVGTLVVLAEADGELAQTADTGAEWPEGWQVWSVVAALGVFMAGGAGWYWMRRRRKHREEAMDADRPFGDVTEGKPEEAMTTDPLFCGDNLDGSDREGIPDDLASRDHVFQELSPQGAGTSCLGAAEQWAGATVVEPHQERADARTQKTHAGGPTRPRKGPTDKGSVWWGRCWMLGCLLLGSLLLYPALPTSWFGTGSKQAQTAHSAATPRTRKIEDVRVGDRVLADNPTGEEDRSLGTEVDPATWRKIELRAPKRDGTWAEVVLLRPVSWLAARGARAGGTLEIAVPECGIDGHAELLSIAPCPPIKPGNGRVVTGTFKHSSAKVIDLYVAGQAEPIGTTANHRFWSEDRGAFVPAEALKPGERLRSVSGNPRVTAIGSNAATAAVFNLEVERVHVYHVSSGGILVHNATPDPKTIIEGVVGQGVEIEHIQIPANSRVPITEAEGITYFVVDRDSGRILKVGSTGRPNSADRFWEYREYLFSESSSS
jgi:RHS repeat-associated protein